MEIDEKDARIGHEATVSKVGDDQLFYLMSRGLTEQQATAMIVNGFIEPITKTLPMEYAVELSRLIELNMEGASGSTGLADDDARALHSRSSARTPRSRLARRRAALAAAERLADVAWPTAAEEIWRYSRIGELDLDRFRPVPAEQLGEPGDEPAPGGGPDRGRGRRALGARRRAQRSGRAPRARRRRSRPRACRSAASPPASSRRARRRCSARAPTRRPTRSPCCTTPSSPAARS